MKKIGEKRDLGFADWDLIVWVMRQTYESKIQDPKPDYDQRPEYKLNESKISVPRFIGNERGNQEWGQAFFQT